MVSVRSRRRRPARPRVRPLASFVVFKPQVVLLCNFWALQPFQSSSDAASERCSSAQPRQEERWGWTLCSNQLLVAHRIVLWQNSTLSTVRNYAESASSHFSREAVVERLGTDLRKRVSVALVGAAFPAFAGTDDITMADRCLFTLPLERSMAVL
jgi:hypothetical protein